MKTTPEIVKYLEFEYARLAEDIRDEEAKIADHANNPVELSEVCISIPMIASGMAMIENILDFIKSEKEGKQ